MRRAASARRAIRPPLSRRRRTFLHANLRPMPDIQLTWLGHASFRFDTPGGKRVYVDPFLSNPKCPEGEKEPERIDVIAITHGHGDHVGETVELAKRFSPEIVANVELKGWLGNQGAPVGDVPGSNKGGTVEAAGIKFTLGNAFPSSSSHDGAHLGEARRIGGEGG